MITFFNQIFKDWNKFTSLPTLASNYKAFTSTLCLNNIICHNCNSNNSFVRHAYYKRSYYSPNNLIYINILRIKCKCCKKTFALLPPDIIPYSRLLLKYHQDIHNAYLEKKHDELLKISSLLNIDFNIIDSCIKNFSKISLWIDIVVNYFTQPHPT